MMCTDEIAFRSRAARALIETRVNCIGIKEFTTVPTWRGEGGPVAPKTGITPEGAGDLVTLKPVRVLRRIRRRGGVMSAPVNYRH
jgi:hypothetical protein